MQRHPVVAGLGRIDVDLHRRRPGGLDAGHEAGAAVAGVLGVELRAAGHDAVLELVEPVADGRDVAGQRVERVPRLGAQQLRAVLRVERPRGADVDDAVRLEVGDLERDDLAVGGDRRLGHVQRLFTDLRAAVVRGRRVAPLAHVVLVGQVGERRVGERLGVGQLEAAVGQLHLLDVERLGAVRDELLQAELELAGLLPVAAAAETADDDRAVVLEQDVRDAGLKALRHAEVGALVLALDLLQERPLDPAVGDIRDPHLAGERAARDQHRLARRVADLVVRDPHGGRGRALVVEASGLAVRGGRVVVVELARLDVDQLVGGQPAALVVGDEDLVLGTPADAVRRAQATGDVLDRARVLVDLQVHAAVGGALRHGRRAAEVDRDRQVHVEEPVLVEEAERELVEVAVERPRRDPRLALVDAVGVGVDQLDELVLLGDVDRAVDDLDAHRLLQALGELRAGHGGGIGGGLDAGLSFQISPAAVTLLGSPSSSPHVSTSRSSPIHSRPVTFGSKPAGRRLTRL